MPLVLFALAFAGALFLLRQPGSAAPGMPRAVADASPPAVARAVHGADEASIASTRASATASPRAAGQRVKSAAIEPRAVAAPPEEGPTQEPATPLDAQPPVEAVG